MQIIREKIEIFANFWAKGLHIRKKNSIFAGFLWAMVLVGQQLKTIKNYCDGTLHVNHERQLKTKQIARKTHFKI